MRNIIKTVIGATAVAFAVGALGACSTSNQQWHNACTVTAKDELYEVVNGSSTRTKRLSTSCGSFDVGDSLAGGFNSWDTWQKLAVGKVFDIKTGGYRIGFFGEFPTVIELREVKR